MGGPDATPNLWKQLFSEVRASGGYPGNDPSSVRKKAQKFLRCLLSMNLKKSVYIVEASHDLQILSSTHPGTAVGGARAWRWK